MLIFSTRDEIFLVFTKKKKKRKKKKVNFLFLSFFFLSLRGKIPLFPSHFSVIFQWLNAFSGYNVGCERSLHQENGLLCHFDVILMMDNKKFSGSFSPASPNGEIGKGEENDQMC